MRDVTAFSSSRFDFLDTFFLLLSLLRCHYHSIVVYFFQGVALY